MTREETEATVRDKFAAWNRHHAAGTYSMCPAPRGSLPGPSRTITVEPVETPVPAREPATEPAERPSEPVPEPVPEPDRDPVPAL